MGLADDILALLGRMPGLKAVDIARELSINKRKVNRLLYGALSDRVKTDADYRWSLKVPPGRHTETVLSSSGVNAHTSTPEPVEAGDSVQEPARPAPTSDRIEKVRAAVERWVGQLVDLTGRNRLLFYRKLKRGSLELTDGSEAALATLLDGRRVKLSQLLPSTDEEPDRTDEAILNARTIYRKARSLFEERGIETLFVVVGIASWVTDTTRATPAAPLLMAPIALKPVGSGEVDYSVEITGDWRINDTLLLYLAEAYDASIDAATVLDLFEPASNDRTAVYERFRKEAHQAPSITVRDRIGIGTFQYTKLPMVRDLEQNLEELAANDLVAAIAGDESVQDAIRERRTEIDPAFPNEIAPADEFLVLDADSSQNHAINAVVAGESVVIQGPPGTGKSQTIANLIATLTARGKKVLFVAEKRAAIDAVTKRLRAVGLDSIVLDLHGGIGSRRDLAAALATSLDRVKTVVAPNDANRDYRLVENRAALIESAESLHRVRDPFDVSIYDAYVGVAALPDDVGLPIRLTSSQFNDLDAAAVREARSAISEWADLTAPFRARATSWIGTTIATSDQAVEAMQAASEVSAVAKATAAELDAVLAETGLSAPDTIDAWSVVFGVLDEINAIDEIADMSILRVDDNELSQLSTAIEAGRRSVLARTWARVFDAEYRGAISRVREYWTAGGRASGARLADLVDRVEKARTGWASVGGSGEIRLPSAMAVKQSNAKELERRLAVLGAFFMVSPATQLSHGVLPEWSAQLVAQQDMLYRLPRVADLQQWLHERHLQPLLEAVADGQIADESAASALDYVWFESIIAIATAADPVLARFDGASQGRRVITL